MITMIYARGFFLVWMQEYIARKLENVKYQTEFWFSLKFISFFSQWFEGSYSILKNASNSLKEWNYPLFFWDLMQSSD